MPVKDISSDEFNSKIQATDPTKDYLTAGSLTGLGYPVGSPENVLSSASDDVMAAYGSQLYEEMMKDPKVSKCINILKIYTIGDGVELVPCVGENDPNYNTALLIEQFCSDSIRQLEKPLRLTLESMLDALIYGHKIAEITYKIADMPNKEVFKDTYLLPKSIKVKPFGSAKFVVNDTYSVLGVVGNAFLAKNNNSYREKERLSSEKIVQKNDGVFIKVDGKEKKFLNRDKFMILTVRGKDEDPRGQSLLRPAFNPWHLKCQVYPEYLRYLLVCAIPLIVGFTPKEDASTPGADIVRNIDGTPVLDSNGQMIRVNPVAALRGALMEARNATALALKGGSEVKEIANNNNGTAFYRAIETLNEEIEMAILLQTLATSESRYQTRSASQTHMTTLDQLVWWFKGVITDMIAQDLLKTIVKYNFGDWALKFLPKVSLGDTERRDFSIDAAAVAALYVAGYISEDQKRYLDNMLGIPPRDENYNPFKKISPTESLQIAKSVFEQEKLQTEVEVGKEKANTERVGQLEKLNNMLISGSLSKEAAAGVERLIQSITLSIETQSKTPEENQILQGLVDASARAEWITGRPSEDIGNLRQLPNTNIVSTSQVPTGPRSGPDVKGGYIPKKASASTSFSKIRNSFKALKDVWFGGNNEDEYTD